MPTTLKSYWARVRRSVRLNWFNTVNSNQNPNYISSRSYTCGHCGEPLASGVGYASFEADENGRSIRLSTAALYICCHCYNLTYFSVDGKQTPGQLTVEP